MASETRASLDDLLRRVDEVRGLAPSSSLATPVAAGDAGALIGVVETLVEELERSHRRLIETNVQLVSLREVASRMVATHDAAGTTRTVTRFLARAFGYPHAFLLLLDRDRGVLEGTWTAIEGGREHNHAFELTARGDRGAALRALWMHRSMLWHDAQRHAPFALPNGHPLDEVLAGLGSVACVPLQRSQSLLPRGETHEVCGARCVLGDAGMLAPPPGRGADDWALSREERQQHCLQCEWMPVLGLIGLARSRRDVALTAADLTLLESIALSVAPMVENARLTQDLRRSERFRFHVLDSMASALVAVDLQGAVLTINRAAEQLLGWTADEIVGRPFGACAGEDGERLLQAALDTGREAMRQETMLRGRDGTPIPVSLTTSLLRNEKRSVYGAIATFVDLTPLKRAEERVRSQDRLAALGRFTSSVAHEIRNPLTGIAAGVQYFERSLDLPEARENVEFILSEIRRLDRIVQDLFDVTHPRGLQRLAQPLDGTIKRSLQSLEALLVSRGVTVRVVVAPMTPPPPHDADSMQQVLINLIKNAAEASPPGSEVRVSIAPGPAEGEIALNAAPPSVVVRITDLGHGIDPEHLATLFEPFFTTKPGGTGLGLYICHDIMKRHGGALTVQSTSGRGTTFTLELPMDFEGDPS
ncbi:MAG: PAS domain S-box protein [Candidatus Eisenbacteria bacterium]|uniref:histidine kinase n=1 Tax=Eiseniibacteriota bacterium TaxID=2212470 RepID=A0A849STB0_UNCEI|nr:PAS domain S-box protein [Candidatus Eisenbacteria bacterium]